MEYYPIQSSDSGGGGGVLLACAHIVRTADAYCVANSYRTILRGCELVNVSGQEFGLDYDTGVMTIPEGARTVRYTLWQYTGGNSRSIYLRLRCDDEADGSCFYRDMSKSYIQYIVSRDVSEFSTVAPVVYFQDGGFTLPNSLLYGNLGMVEFFA